MPWHLYGVLDRGELPERFLTEPPRGLQDVPVTALEFGSMAVVASELAQPPQRPTPLDLAAHAEVLGGLVKAGCTVVPFRFGVTAPSESAVGRLVQLNGGELRRCLGRLAGKVEASLVGFWERDGLRSALLRMPQVRRWVDQDGALPPERAHTAAVEVGQAAHAVVQRWRAGLTPAIRRALATCALEVRESEPIGIRMVFNLALLVPRARQEELVQTVGALQQRLRGRLRLRLAVPLAPFTFCDMTLRWEPAPAPQEGGPIH